MSPDKLAILTISLPLVVASLLWIGYITPSIYRAIRR